MISGGQSIGPPPLFFIAVFPVEREAGPRHLWLTSRNIFTPAVSLTVAAAATAAALARTIVRGREGAFSPGTLLRHRQYANCKREGGGEEECRNV